MPDNTAQTVKMNNPPNGIRENAEAAISCRGPGTARKKNEVYL